MHILPYAFINLAGPDLIVIALIIAILALPGIIAALILFVIVRRRGAMPPPLPGQKINPGSPRLEAQQRNWWDNNARWVLPFGCLGLTGIIGAAAIAVVVLIYGALRSSDPYQNALAAANADTRVVQVLGSPITDRLFVTGSFNTSGPRGRAEFTLPVRGPKGNATIYAVASKSAGYWNFEALAVEVADTRERIDLLHESDSTSE
jgi:hypothetical protein